MKILHLSDLHFGTERPGIVQVLKETCIELRPDYIIVSGDLTQRAKKEQYTAVMRFLTSLNAKILSVPGNHDISLYNPFERFFYPFSKYKRYIAPNTESQVITEDVSILGINSVTPYKAMSGYVTKAQLKRTKDFFAKHRNTFNIVVMHHNLISSERHKIINNSDDILRVFAEAGVNIVLSGHIHFPQIELLKKDFITNYLYIITAGTAISTRTIAPNSFNLLTLQSSGFTFAVHECIDNEFIAKQTEFFPLHEESENS